MRSARALARAMIGQEKDFLVTVDKQELLVYYKLVVVSVLFFDRLIKLPTLPSKL